METSTHVPGPEKTPPKSTNWWAVAYWAFIVGLTFLPIPASLAGIAYGIYVDSKPTTTMFSFAGVLFFVVSLFAGVDLWENLKKRAGL